MGRILALDYGKKRTGIAVTDPLRLIASALTTVHTNELIGFLKNYCRTESIDLVLIGYPLNFDDSPTDATPLVEKFIPKFQHVFPDIPIRTVDERMSSAMASRSIAMMNLSRKQREQKELVDAVSATILLQEYLESHS